MTERRVVNRTRPLNLPIGAVRIALNDMRHCQLAVPCTPATAEDRRKLILMFERLELSLMQG